MQSMGGCNRCQMINLYQSSGQVIKSKEPLATLASYRRKQVGSCAVLCLAHLCFSDLITKIISHVDRERFCLASC